MRFNKILFAVIVGALWANDVYAARCNFSCGDGQGTPPASCGSSASNHCSVWPQNTCTPPSGYVFAGWLFKSYVVQPGISDAYLNTCSSSSTTATYTVTAQYQVNPNPINPNPTPASPRNTVTSKSYVDSEFSQKQDIIPALGDEYAVIYGPSSGKLDWYHIDTSVTSSSTRLITAGAVVSSLNGKQNKISGTSGNVVTYTGSSGGVSSKPVYNSSFSYNANALAKIENVNDTVVNAFNAHVTCYEYATPGDSSSCILWNVNQLSGTYVPHN